MQPGCGTLFALTRSSSGFTETVLHDFGGQDANPNGSLVVDTAGNFYGADSNDVFALARIGVTGTWKKTVLHTFGGVGDGKNPRAPLLLNSAGDLFGVTYEGGLSGKGVVFEIAQ